MFSTGVIGDDRSVSIKLNVDFNQDKGNTHWGYSLQAIASTGGDATPGSMTPRYIKINGNTHEIFRFINSPFTVGTALWVLGGTQEDSNNIYLSVDSITSIATDLGILKTSDMGSSDTQTGNFTTVNVFTGGGVRVMNRWQWCSAGTGTSGANPTLPDIIGTTARDTFCEITI